MAWVVARSALGTHDDRGDFRALASDGALREVGIGFPPYHGLCRTTTLAVVCATSATRRSRPWHRSQCKTSISNVRFNRRGIHPRG